MQFSSCKSHVELGAAYVFIMESGTVSIFTMFSSLVGARTSICPDVIDFVWCALFLSHWEVGARTSICPELIDCVWCALFPGRCDVSLGIFRLLVTSESANIEGARVLTTIEVPRAVSGQVGSGSGVQIVHVYVYNACISVSLDTNYPFHGCAHYLIWSYPW